MKATCPPTPSSSGPSLLQIDWRFCEGGAFARALGAEERAEAIKRVRDHVAPGPKPQTELPTRLALSASELERE